MNDAVQKAVDRVMKKILDGEVKLNPTFVPPDAEYQWFDIRAIPTNFKDPVCECGSDKAKLPTHSTWCPKYEEL